MTAAEWTVIVAVLAIGGQVVNVFLILRVRVAVLEMRNAIMDKADQKYTAAPVCMARMKDHDRRLERLEEAIQ